MVGGILDFALRPAWTPSSVQPALGGRVHVYYEDIPV